MTLEFAKAKRRLARAAIERGDLGNLPAEVEADLARKIKPYVSRAYFAPKSR